MIGDKPVYESVIDEWRGKKFDLGLFWLGEKESPRPFGLCHPYMLDVMEMGPEERADFVSYVEGKLRELRAR